MQNLEKNYENLLVIFLIFHFFLWASSLNKVIDIRFLIIILPFIIFNKFNLNLFRINLNIYYLFFFLIIVIHYFYSSKILNIDIKSITILKILLLFTLAFIINQNIHIIESNFNKFINFSLYILLFLISFEMILHLINSNFFFLKFSQLSNCYDGYFRRFSKIFLEESHYGMVVPSLIIASTIINFEKKFLINFLLTQLLIIFSIFYALSLTFILSIILGSIIAILLTRGIKIKIYFTLIILVILLFAKSNVNCAHKFFNITYSLSKNFNNKIITSFLETQNNHYYNIKKLIENDGKKELKHSNSNINKNEEPHIELSSIIYLKGINNLKLTLQNQFFGFGFDNYQFAFEKYNDKSSKNINKSYYKDWVIKNLNNNDGSNNSIKLFVEFGLFSLTFVVLIIFFFFNKNFKSIFKVFFINIIVTQLFIRGAGYFNGGFIVSFLVLTFIYFKNLDEKNI